LLGFASVDYYPLDLIHITLWGNKTEYIKQHYQKQDCQGVITTKIQR